MSSSQQCDSWVSFRALRLGGQFRGSIRFMSHGARQFGKHGYFSSTLRTYRDMLLVYKTYGVAHVGVCRCEIGAYFSYS